MSLGFWKSHKLDSKVGSPMASEAYAAKKAIEDLKWYVALLNSFTYADYGLAARKRKGEVTVQSAKGEGTEFEVKLPCVTPRGGAQVG